MQTVVKPAAAPPIGDAPERTIGARVAMISGSLVVISAILPWFGRMNTFSQTPNMLRSDHPDFDSAATYQTNVSQAENYIALDFGVATWGGTLLALAAVLLIAFDTGAANTDRSRWIGSAAMYLSLAGFGWTFGQLTRPQEIGFVDDLDPLFGFYISVTLTAAVAVGICHDQWRTRGTAT